MTLQKLRELRGERAGLIKQGRTILDKAEKETRNLTGEERAEWERLHKAQGEMEAQITMEERQLEVDRAMAQATGDTDAQRRANGDGGGDNEEFRDAAGNTIVFRENQPRESRSYYRAFVNYLKRGRTGLEPEEYRALQADSDPDGGYTVAPMQFVTQLIKFVDDLVFIRQLATVQRIDRAQSLGAPSLDTDLADADWTSEIATGSEDTALKFGRRELSPHPLAKRIKVSGKLLRVSSMPIENIVRTRVGFKFAVTQEKAFLTGTGAQQALGVFTASANGISTARDVSTGNTTTEIRFDGLKEVKYSMKAQYWPRLRWVFHRDALKQISKLKDGEGRYIWDASVQVGQPDRILSFPVNMSEFAPNTFTTGLYVGILGDFSFYWIVDAMALQIQRLVELYAETNQIGFIGRQEVDGMPVLEEAFARVKLL